MTKEDLQKGFMHITALIAPPPDSIEAAEMCIDLANEYAKQEAIAFKNWCDENERELRLENMSTTNPAITTEQLFQQFKKEQP